MQSMIGESIVGGCSALYQSALIVCSIDCSHSIERRTIFAVLGKNLASLRKN
jgi:hypothetical protein